MSFIKKTKIISIVLIFNFIYLNDLNSETLVLPQINTVPNNSVLTLPNTGQISYMLQNGTNTQIQSTIQNPSQINPINYGAANIPYVSNNIGTVLYSTNNKQNNTSGRIYSKGRNKSCVNEFYNSNNSNIFDLSDTYDINTNGHYIIQAIIKTAKERNYDFIYIDLCNTEVHPMYIGQWNQLLKQNNIQVTWNLSNNSIIDDNLFIYLNDLSNIKGLNISNTNVSTNGIIYLCNILQNSVDCTIQYINICGLNLDFYTKSILNNTFEQHKALWEQKNNTKYITYDNGIIDNYNGNNINTLSYNQQLNTINQQSIIPNQIQQLGLQQGQITTQQILPLSQTSLSHLVGQTSLSHAVSPTRNNTNNIQNQYNNNQSPINNVLGQYNSNQSLNNVLGQQYTSNLLGQQLNQQTSAPISQLYNNQLSTQQTTIPTQYVIPSNVYSIVR